MDDETVIETAPETPAETRIDEAENTAETAIDIADNAHDRITQLEDILTQLVRRVETLESSYSNASTLGRTNDGNASGNTADDTADNSTETGATAQEPIRPNREHPYFRKLW